MVAEIFNVNILCMLLLVPIVNATVFSTIAIFFDSAFCLFYDPFMICYKKYLSNHVVTAHCVKNISTNE